MFKILIAEDDTKLCQLFERILIKNGYYTKGVSNGKEALDAISNEYFDLLITDIMMPIMDGYELIENIRESGNNIPILIVTAKNEFNDLKMGFVSGTDDFMVKPININELVIRVGALLRRAQMINSRRQTIGSTILECDSLTITANNESIIMPQKEFMLLYKMASYPGKIFTRQELMDDIWGYDSNSETHTVDVHINRLRDKFKNNSDFEIVTIRGIGYKVVKKWVKKI